MNRQISPKPLELADRLEFLMASSVRSTNCVSTNGRTVVISVCNEGGNKYILQIFNLFSSPQSDSENILFFY